MDVITRLSRRERYRRLQEGMSIPRWQGIIMYDPATRCDLIAPIPLNWLILWAWRLKWRLQRGSYKQELLWAYELGLQDEKANIRRQQLLEELESVIKERNGHR